MPLSTVKQLSLYAHRIYVHDELLKIALDYPSLDAFSYLGRSESRPERVRRYENYVSGVIKEMLEIKMLVLSGIVYLAPTELVSKEATLQQANNDTSGSHAGGESRQPLTPSLEEYFRSHTKAHPAAFFQGTPNIYTSVPLTPRTNIAVTIEGEDKNYLFNVMQSFVVEKLEREHNIRGFIDPEIEPEQEFHIDFDKVDFWGWVAEKKEGVFRQKLERLLSDVTRAKANRARFVTSSPVTRDLLALSGADVVQEKTIQGVLSMELPYVDNVPVSAIVRARKEEGAYEQFKATLDKAIESVDAEMGSPEFQKKLDEISRDVIRLPLLEIDKQMGRFRQKLFATGTAGVGTLALTIMNPTAPMTWGAIALTVGGAMTTLHLGIKPDQEKVQDMPAYFYWQAVSRHRK